MVGIYSNINILDVNMIIDYSNFLQSIGAILANIIRYD